jgi:hypothetical protein
MSSDGESARCGFLKEMFETRFFRSCIDFLLARLIYSIRFARSANDSPS